MNLGGFAVFLVFQLLGEALRSVFALPVPGPVIGLIGLLAFLLLRPNAAAGLQPSAGFLHQHFSLLFIPAGVGVMTFGSLFADGWWVIALSLVLSTLLGLATTAWLAVMLVPDEGDQSGESSDALPHDR